MSMPWDYYIKRRGVNIVNFLKSRNCQTYEQLCKVLVTEGIEPPTEKDVESYFLKAKTRKKPAPKKQTLGTKSSVKQPPKSASRHERVRQTKSKADAAKKAEVGKESEQS